MENAKRTPASLKKMVEEFHFEILHEGADFDSCVVTVADLNRPALQLVGFYDYFDANRMQVLGMAEMMFLRRMENNERYRVFNKLFSYAFPALIVSRNLDVFPEMQELAERHGRTVLRTAMDTVDVSSAVVDYLNRALAPQITRHGVLMNIYGQGVLLLGESGVGKSETAIELLKRGHRLVADDAVDIRRISDTLWGRAPELIRHYIEIRGVGLIDVRKLFGMGAVQFESEIELVVQLEPWIDGKFYDRLGLESDTYTMLDLSVPMVTIPVRPGRNLAGIVEVAVMKNRQTKYGYNAAQDFVNQYDQAMSQMSQEGNIRL